ncbi:MAG: TolC family protein [Polyangiales bacterium]
MSIRSLAGVAPILLVLVAASAYAQTSPVPSGGSTGPTTVPTVSTPQALPTDVGTPNQPNKPSASAITTPSPTGTAGGLTSENAATQAVATSVSAKVDQAKLAQAGAQVDQAWDAYWPRLSFLARYTRLSPITLPVIGNPPGVFSVVTGGPGVQSGQPVPAGTPLIAASGGISFPVILDQYTTQVSLLVPLSDYVFRLYKAHDAALLNLEASKWNAKVNAQIAATDARVAYYNVLRAHGAVVVARAAVDQSEAHLKDLKNQFAAKVVTVADVARVEATMANAQLALIKSENLVVVTEAQLRVLMHQNGEAPLTYAEDLTAELPKMSIDLKQLKSDAMSKRPELKVLDAQVASAEKQTDVIAAGAYPRIDALGNFTYANPNSRFFPQTAEWKATWDVSLQLTWSPNDWLTTHDNKKGAQAQIAQLKASRDQIVDGLILDVTTAYTRVKEAEASIGTTATELRAAEEAYRVRKEQFALGATTSALLIDTEADLTRARLNHLNARVDLRIARVQLRKAIGDA